MTQNIYDNPGFFEGYSQLRRSVEGLKGAAEWPRLQAMLPDLHGLRIADLGCGYGWFCRWARRRGAVQVTGFDVSEKMLARAMATASDDGITYVKADLESLELPESSVDVVYSSLALHYIEDLSRLLSTVHRSLVVGGSLAFSIEHPIYMASKDPGWLIDAEGRRRWPVDNYQMEGPRTTDWFIHGVVKQHRTIGTVLNLLIDLGFVITHVEEWGPTEEQIRATPQLVEERERPMFLLVGARR